MVFFVAIFDMTFPAQGHEVLDLVLSFTATHSTGHDVVDINSSLPAHLTRNKVIRAIAKMI
jgi:hypothetical protein